jgi:hypothetical protein
VSENVLAAPDLAIEKIIQPRESNSLSGYANPAEQNANVELRNPGNEVVDRSATNSRRFNQFS